MPKDKCALIGRVCPSNRIKYKLDFLLIDDSSCLLTILYRTVCTIIRTSSSDIQYQGSYPTMSREVQYQYQYQVQLNFINNGFSIQVQFVQFFDTNQRTKFLFHDLIGYQFQLCPCSSLYGPTNRRVRSTRFRALEENWSKNESTILILQ